MEHPFIRLSRGEWTAWIAPDQGANVVCLKCRGEDVLMPPRADNSDPFLVGAPLLLPANRTHRGTFPYGGVTYQMEVNDAYSNSHLHGLLHKQPFKVLVNRENRAVLTYENRGQGYPFPYRIRVTYSLEETGLHSSYLLENRGDIPMPFTFGLHTTFREPEQFRVPILERQEKDDHHIPTGRYVPLGVQEQQYVTGSSSRGRTITGYYRAGGDTAQVGAYTYRVEGFDHWVLYNAQGKAGVLCVEPQLGAVNGLNLPAGCRVIPEGGQVLLQTWIEKIPSYEHFPAGI